MKASAKIVCDIIKPEHLETIFRALEPEVRSPATLRSSVSLTKERGSLVLKATAKDTVALRATLNTYLRWMKSLISALEVLERIKQADTSVLARAVS